VKIEDRIRPSAKSSSQALTIPQNASVRAPRVPADIQSPSNNFHHFEIVDLILLSSLLLQDDIVNQWLGIDGQSLLLEYSMETVDRLLLRLEIEI
jgi:hypothetical protein